MFEGSKEVLIGKERDVFRGGNVGAVRNVHGIISDENRDWSSAPKTILRLL